MEQAYKLAKEAGYEGRVYSSHGELLDPEFWRALGKAMGWGGSATWVCTDTCDWWCNDCKFGLVKQTETPLEFRGGVHVDCPKSKLWLVNWHRFIDHLAEGKDAESFFNELLK
jgi:hypothetical protein